MMPLEIATLFVIAVASFFLWAWIHEMAHVLAAKVTVGVEWYKINLLPEKRGDTLYWAYVQYKFHRPPEKGEEIFIHLAPRLFDLVAVICLPLIALLSLPLFWKFAFSIILFGGIIDAIVGSIGKSTNSDLRRACSSSFGLWSMRVAGLFFSFASIVLWLALIL